MKRISLSGNFQKFYLNNYTYIDKTKLISDLLSTYEKILITRPRRFGKSLTLDTIGTLFENGVDPYFKGTWIYHNYNEKTYPVLRLNFARFDNKNTKTFKKQIINQLLDFAKSLSVNDLCDSSDLSFCINSLLKGLWAQKKQVVILIDEYDCQLCANINNSSLYNEFQSILRTIYASLKDQMAIKFMAVTGVTRLKDVTIFSVGSDIVDISYDSYYSQLIGFTRDEIKNYYIDYVKTAAAIDNNCTFDDVSDALIDKMLDKMATAYDGYCFDEKGEKKVFSTWSVNNFLSKAFYNKECVFANYWYDNGGIPTILANYLQNHKLSTIENISNNALISVSANDFKNPTTLTTMNESVLMYQTGYLTLHSPISDTEILLKVPNDEVYKALLTLLASNIFGDKLKVFNANGVNVIEDGTVDDIIELFNTTLNTVSYDNYPINNEASLQSLLHLYLKAITKHVYTEQHSSKGRADLIVETDNRRIVIELKYSKNENESDRLLDEAIEQIKTRDYGNILPIKKELIKIAAVFNANTRSFDKYESL